MGMHGAYRAFLEFGAAWGCTPLFLAQSLVVSQLVENLTYARRSVLSVVQQNHWKRVAVLKPHRSFCPYSEWHRGPLDTLNLPPNMFPTGAMSVSYMGKY